MTETPTTAKKENEYNNSKTSTDTGEVHVHEVADHAQDIAKSAYESTKSVAIQCKHLACEGGHQLSVLVRKHPKEALAVLVASLGVIGLFSHRKSIRKFDAKKKVINPLVDKSHQAKSALSDLWDRQ